MLRAAEEHIPDQPRRRGVGRFADHRCRPVEAREGVAQWLGAEPAVVLGGVATCVVVLLWMLLFPALRRIDRLDGSELG